MQNIKLTDQKLIMSSTNTNSHTVNKLVLHTMSKNYVQKIGVMIFTSIGLATAAWIWVSLILA